MGEERDKNIRHPRPAHDVKAFFLFPYSQLSRDFFLFRRLKFFKSKINSTAISNGQSPFLAREIWTARVWKSTAKKEERQKKKKKRGGGRGRECCCHWRRVGAWWTDHRQHTHTHNWLLAVATATIEAGLLCVQEQHPVCVTATPSFLLSSSSLLCLCVSVLCCWALMYVFICELYYIARVCEWIWLYITVRSSSSSSTTRVNWMDFLWGGWILLKKHKTDPTQSAKSFGPSFFYFSDRLKCV